ncbi:uncharacterized protein METZ01_LOCUS170136 [marine metagenome]|uniref:Uncharacterized protein n=1 Tax=marine metagenome TaxID=408172 RepID=A0A382BUX2_9ZZZZ
MLPMRRSAASTMSVIEHPMFDSMASVVPHVRAGYLASILVRSIQRRINVHSGKYTISAEAGSSAERETPTPSRVSSRGRLRF